MGPRSSLENDRNRKHVRSHKATSVTKKDETLGGAATVVDGCGVYHELGSAKKLFLFFSFSRELSMQIRIMKSDFDHFHLHLIFLLTSTMLK